MVEDKETRTKNITEDFDETGDKSPEGEYPVESYSETLKKQKKEKNIIQIEDMFKYENSSKKVVERMKEVYETDKRLQAQEKPSINKLNEVKNICDSILKKEHQELCIKNGVLIELRKWIEPLEDHSLPNIKIVDTILNLLYKLRPTREDLIESKIGYVIHFYAINRTVEFSIKKKAIKIMDKWKKSVSKEVFYDE